MGPGGGSAPGVGSSGGRGGGSSHPGRPGGEAGPSVDGSGGYSGYGGNSDTSSFGSSSGGSESIRGAKAASYSFNAPDAGGMMSFRSDRQAARSLDGVGSFGLNGTDQGGVANGQVAGDGSLDTTTAGYKAVVGDGELSENRQLNESLMQARDLNPPDVRAKADAAALAADKNRIDQATDDNPMRSLLPAPVEALADLGENFQAQKDFNADLEGIKDQYSLQDGYFGEPGFRDATEAAISEGTGGLIGNRDRMGRVAIGIAEDRSPSGMPKGKGNGGEGILEPYIPPNKQTQTQNPNPEDPSYHGRLTNYGSYRRRVLNRLG